MELLVGLVGRERSVGEAAQVELLLSAAQELAARADPARGGLRAGSSGGGGAVAALGRFGARNHRSGNRHPLVSPAMSYVMLSPIRSQFLVRDWRRKVRFFRKQPPRLAGSAQQSVR